MSPAWALMAGLVVTALVVGFVLLSAMLERPTSHVMVVHADCHVVLEFEVRRHSWVCISVAADAPVNTIVLDPLNLSRFKRGDDYTFECQTGAQSEHTYAVPLGPGDWRLAIINYSDATISATVDVSTPEGARP